MLVVVVLLLVLVLVLAALESGKLPVCVPSAQRPTSTQARMKGALLQAATPQLRHVTLQGLW